MKAYWYDGSEADQREDHDSRRPVDEDYLQSLGVLYFSCPDIKDVDKIALERDYKNRDEIVVSPQTMGKMYEEKVKSFFHEHLHEDEEIRYIMDGEGFFDVRGLEDDWIRIKLIKDDLIILPAGIYHRFTTDTNDYIRAMRLFKDEPKWTPLNRCEVVEENRHRRQYLAEHTI